MAVAFAKKVFLIVCAWGFEDAPGKMMVWAFKKFMIDMGLYSNPFPLYYGCWESLTTKGMWFKNIWHLACHLNITIKMNAEHFIQPV